MLEVASEKRQDPARLAVKSSPEGDHLALARVGLSQADRGLDGFGPAAVELRSAKVPGRDLREELHQGGPVLGREASHMNPRQLPPERLYVARMRIPQAGHADAGQQVDVAIAVDVVEQCPLTPVDAEPCKECDALNPWREIFCFGVEPLLGRRAGQREGGRLGGAHSDSPGFALWST